MDVDWTAVAAGIALFIWVADKIQRSRERSATRRLLAQIMTSPIGNARLEIVAVRSQLAIDGASQLQQLLISPKARTALWERVQAISVDLPSQFYDKADTFDRSTATILAAAVSSVNEVRSIVRMTSELPVNTANEDFYNHINLIGQKVIDSDTALERAFTQLARVGRAG